MFLSSREQFILYLRNLRFRYERFLSLRGFSIYVTLTFFFFIVYCVLLVVHWVVLYLFDIPWESKVSLPWHIVLEMLSPARLLSQTSSSLMGKSLAVMTTLVGIGFLSTLIAYTTTTTTSLIQQFRRGVGQLLF